MSSARKKAVAPMFFRAIMALILGIIVLVVLIRGVTDAIYGACWDKARTGMIDLKDGANQVSLGDCIDKVYIVPKAQLYPLFQTDKLDIFKCTHRDDTKEGYLYFAIIKPSNNVNVTEIVESGGQKLQQSLLDTFCVEYKYNFNTNSKLVLDGKKDYCITLTPIKTATNSNAPNIEKYIAIREGQCVKSGGGQTGGAGSSGIW
jgi:hypothetical protein